MSEMADALVLMSVEDDGVAFLPYIFCVLKSPCGFITKNLFLSWHFALEDRSEKYLWAQEEKETGLWAPKPHHP